MFSGKIERVGGSNGIDISRRPAPGIREPVGFDPSKAKPDPVIQLSRTGNILYNAAGAKVSVPPVETNPPLQKVDMKG